MGNITQTVNCVHHSELEGTRGITDLAIGPGDVLQIHLMTGLRIDIELFDRNGADGIGIRTPKGELIVSPRACNAVQVRAVPG